MAKSVEFDKCAAECRALVRDLPDDKARAHLQSVAEAWERLAQKEQEFSAREVSPLRLAAARMWLSRTNRN